MFAPWALSVSVRRYRIACELMFADSGLSFGALIATSTMVPLTTVIAA
jgi:hypothetical protein